MPNQSNITAKPTNVLAFTDNTKAKQQQMLFSSVQKDLINANKEEEDDEYEEEDEEEDCDFDANELLNLTDYQNKRKQ